MSGTDGVKKKGGGGGRGGLCRAGRDQRAPRVLDWVSELDEFRLYLRPGSLVPCTLSSAGEGRVGRVFWGGGRVGSG